MFFNENKTEKIFGDERCEENEYSNVVVRQIVNRNLVTHHALGPRTGYNVWVLLIGSKQIRHGCEIRYSESQELFAFMNR